MGLSAKIVGICKTLLAASGISSSSTSTQLRVADGTAALPAITGSDTDSGIYFITNQVSLSVAGAEKVRVESTQTLMAGQLVGGGSCVIYGYKRAVWSLTVDTSLAASQYSWSTITNAGAAGAVNCTAVTAIAGYQHTFTVEAAQYLRFTAATGDVISGFLSGTGGSITTSATAGYIRSNVVGSTLTLEAIDATTWRIVSITGTWTIDS